MSKDTNSAGLAFLLSVLIVGGVSLVSRVAMEYLDTEKEMVLAYASDQPSFIASVF